MATLSSSRPLTLITPLQDGEDKHLLHISDAHSALSDIKSEGGDFTGASEELRKALDVLARLPEPDLRRCVCVCVCVCGYKGVGNKDVRLNGRA